MNSRMHDTLGSLSLIRYRSQLGITIANKIDPVHGIKHWPAARLIHLRQANCNSDGMHLCPTWTCNLLTVKEADSVKWCTIMQWTHGQCLRPHVDAIAVRCSCAPQGALQPYGSSGNNLELSCSHYCGVTGSHCVEVL